jgi:hypothetical protein
MGRLIPMAEVRLGRFEVEKDQLPMICMRCGAVATLRKRKKFTWYPPWISILLVAGVLPYIILVRILMKKMTVSAPLCDDHRFHWIWSSLIIPLTLCALVMVCCTGPITINAAGSDRAMDSAMPLFSLMMFGAFVVWFIAMIVVNEVSIHPTEITEHAMTLKGVAPAFADAVSRQRPGDAPGDPSPSRPPQSSGRAGEFFDPRP